MLTLNTLSACQLQTSERVFSLHFDATQSAPMGPLVHYVTKRWWEGVQRWRYNSVTWGGTNWRYVTQELSR